MPLYICKLLDPRILLQNGPIKMCLQFLDDVLFLFLEFINLSPKNCLSERDS
jgi:hypothetical protein